MSLEYKGINFAVGQKVFVFDLEREIISIFEQSSKYFGTCLLKGIGTPVAFDELCKIKTDEEKICPSPPLSTQ
jgi:hypothetical protein